MTRKDYKKIAEVIKDRIDDTEADADSHYIVLARLGRAIADIMEQDNDRFDRVRFLDACGIVNNSL